MAATKFQNRILTALSLLTVVLIAVVVLAFFYSGRMIDAFHWQVHTHEVLALIDDMDLEITNAIMDERAYVITADLAAVEQMNRQLEQIGPTLAKLEKATSDNARQQRLLGTLRAELDQRIASIREIAAARKEKGFEAASALVHADAGQRLTQKINADFDQIRNMEETLLKERSARAESDSIGVLATVGAGVLMTVLLVITGALIVYVELKERARLEAELMRARELALETARLKSEFLANMSHEIRTPMNGVIGMAELMQDMNLNRRQKECVDTIYSSAMSLLTIINDILDFSKIEAGKLKFESVHFEVRDVVESVFDLLRDSAYKKNLEIAAFINDDVPASVQGDPTRLRQVLLNLVGNAIKFTAKGEIVVRVSLDSQTPERCVLRFAVSDTGIGMNDEARQRLFQPFSQADTSTTRRFGGTGLGLAISNSIIEMMGGKFSVESAEGKGSTFSFLIPLQRSQSCPVPLKIEPLQGLRVCVVDDHPINRELLRHQLGKWGMRVEEAPGARAALELIATKQKSGEPFDLALLDLNMPEMDGLALAREIQKNDALRYLRLGLISSSHVDRATARAAGIHHLLLKPVRQSQLHDMLMMLISGRLDASSALMTAVVAPKSNARILLAEDNPVNQRVTLTQLEKLGYSARVVENGRQALEALKSAAFDVVLMDCQMPEMDGYTAATNWREYERGRQAAVPVRIVALTAHAMAGEREKCIAAGMDDYLSKPLTLKLLDEALKKWVGKPALPARPKSTVLKDFDLETLKECAGEAGTAEIIEMYFAQLDSQSVALKTAFEAHDRDAVERIAHTCSGSSATCGVLSVGRSMRRMEELARRGNLDGARKEFVVAQEELERARTFLANLTMHGRRQ